MRAVYRASRPFPPAPLSAPATGCGDRGADLPAARGTSAVGPAQAAVRAGQGEGEPAVVPLDDLPGAGPPRPGPSWARSTLVLSAIVHSVPSKSSHLVSKDQHGGRLNCGTTPQQTKF